MPKHIRHTTPEGIASYPWLNKPDTKFDPDGVYKCNILIESDKAKSVISAIDKAYDQNVINVKEETGKSKIKPADKPYVIGSKDDPIVAPGQVMFKVKCKAKIKDTEVRPHVVDSKGTQLVGTDIYGGSKVRVCMDLVPYYVSTTGAGITLRLIGVQVLELQDAPAPDLSTMGFKEEEGFMVENNNEVESDDGKQKQKEEISNEDFI